ncbi:hypothetical protein JCM8547_005404 [Rhodosporidiobolus lusitaniae]
MESAAPPNFAASPFVTMSAIDSASRTIVVLGATGQQGSGVVQHLLERTSFSVVALSRSTTSTAATRLSNMYKRYDGRFEIKQANVLDAESLRKAFEGAYGLFAVTQYSAPLQTEEDMRFELTGGRNIIDAAKATEIKHLIYSGLPSVSAATSNRFMHIWHFEYKAQVEDYAKEVLASSSTAFTILHAQLFFRNLAWPHYAKVNDQDGALEFRAVLGEKKVQSWTDPCYDVGLFASELFLLGPSITHGKTYPVGGSPLSLSDLASTYTRVTGLPARVKPTSLADWTSAVVASQGPGIEQDIGEMVQFFDWEGTLEQGGSDYGAMGKEEYEERMKELGGRVRASTSRSFSSDRHFSLRGE